MKDFINKYLVIGLSLIAFTSCEPYEDYLTDFDYSIVYFPYQQPVRTVVLDSEQKTNVGVVLGGKRENKDRVVTQFEINESLLNETSWELLPEEYYTLGHTSEMVVEPGTFQGLVEINFTDAFYDDPKAITNHYALPLLITQSTADSVLTGSTENGVLAKNYMIPVFKFIHYLEGNWYHHGVDTSFDPQGDTLVSNVYSHKDMVKNDVWILNTLAKNKVSTNGIGSTNNGRLQINISSDNVVEVEPFEGSPITEVTNNLSEYNANTNELYLDYNYSDTDGIKHHVMDTLTFRNLDMELELW
ncbi:DUF1735 domain-containing protein [Flammeovirga agarivorans]|uniref:DUF1735 domain-containing protein n=1 Tax=Flammeovirga agarivorans TaxID=2726742 RepID=A0A7X8SNG9_9BACT|nr:DUF1735 domain-containing protein [Flammeovirga agarivorans]NLR93463.1 DUF1735 domain-containing protein [Flammeovirga agarivorans]